VHGNVISLLGGIGLFHGVGSRFALDVIVLDWVIVGCRKGFKMDLFSEFAAELPEMANSPVT
jgi:hypothetical protein